MDWSLVECQGLTTIQQCSYHYGLIHSNLRFPGYVMHTPQPLLEFTKCTACSCSWHFSWSWRAVKIMSMMLRPLQKLHWLFGRMLFSLICWVSRLRMTRASILPGIESSEILWWSPQTDRSPFRLKMCAISASLNSTDPLLQIDWYSATNLSMMSGHPDLNSSGGRPSDPGALPDGIWLVVRWTLFLSGGSMSS